MPCFSVLDIGNAFNSELVSWNDLDDGANMIQMVDCGLLDCGFNDEYDDNYVVTHLGCWTVVDDGIYQSYEENVNDNDSDEGYDDGNDDNKIACWFC